MQGTQKIHVVFYQINRKWYWQLVRNGRIVGQSYAGRNCRGESMASVKALVDGIKAGHLSFDDV